MLSQADVSRSFKLLFILINLKVEPIEILIMMEKKMKIVDAWLYFWPLCAEMLKKVLHDMSLDNNLF